MVHTVSRPERLGRRQHGPGQADARLGPPRFQQRRVGRIRPLQVPPLSLLRSLALSPHPGTEPDAGEPPAHRAPAPRTLVAVSAAAYAAAGPVVLPAGTAVVDRELSATGPVPVCPGAGGSAGVASIHVRDC